MPAADAKALEAQAPLWLHLLAEGQANLAKSAVSPHRLRVRSAHRPRPGAVGELRARIYFVPCRPPLRTKPMAKIWFAKR